jgi:formate hydrogenlyase subunit 4
MFEMFLYKILLIPVVAAVGIFLGLFYKGVDRILAARMQARVGPPVTQPFRDVKKLMLKENIVPKNAVKWLFNLMPLMALAVSIIILLYMPLFGLAPILEGYGDLILVLYLMIFPSLALVLGGFASGSPYATVGAQREMVSMLSYEFPWAITAVSITWLLSTANPGLAVFSLSVISANPAWGLAGPLGMAGLAILFIVSLFVMPGEVDLTPFDVAEAETEIAGGVLVEYSGRNLALFYMAEAVKMLAFASLIITLFLPYGVSEILNLFGASAIIADALFYLIKLFIIIFIGSIFTRVALARLRITQVVKVYWGYMTFMALCGLVLITIDAILKLI